MQDNLTNKESVVGWTDLGSLLFKDGLVPTLAVTVLWLQNG